jgi:hypothetical protein
LTRAGGGASVDDTDRARDDAFSPSTKLGLSFVSSHAQKWPTAVIGAITFSTMAISVGEIAGGINILANRPKDCVVTAEEVAAREPDLIIGLWYRGPVDALPKVKFAKTPLEVRRIRTFGSPAKGARFERS